ncbi:putative UDP-Gal or UDP-GlcNAc-dependent glycosyltransferase [Trypanosoma cruzi]|nr:putative UDP-Gal or UDP-GlcNAc-dependent glycosyltransferase [Trypanosoma cruzi]
MSLPALDPRAGGGCGASGRQLRCAACVLLLGARDDDLRVCAGPPMNDVCGSVFVIHLFYFNCAIRRWGGFSIFLCVCALLASAFPLLSPHLAVGSRRGCIPVFSCDLFASGASHGAAAVSADGVALGVWRVRAVTLTPSPMRRAGGTTPVAHGLCLLTTQLSLSFYPLLVFSCRRLHSVGAALADGKQTTGGLAGGRRACGGSLHCAGRFWSYHIATEIKLYARVTLSFAVRCSESRLVRRLSPRSGVAGVARAAGRERQQRWLWIFKPPLRRVRAWLRKGQRLQHHLLGDT